MRAMVVVGFSTLALAGCDGAGPGQTPKATATLPTPKAGLWRESLSRDGHALDLIGEVRACLDADARARFSALGGRAGKAMCRDEAVMRDPDGGYRFSSTCDMGPGGRVVTQGLLTGDLSSRYRVHSQTDTSGAGLGSMNGRHVIDLEANYLGPCPADMTPGDVVIANGLKVNMNHLRAAAQAFTGGG